MRTTLTLDKDVAARLEQAARKRRLPFKVIVNDALRARPRGMRRFWVGCAGRDG